MLFYNSLFYMKVLFAYLIIIQWTYFKQAFNNDDWTTRSLLERSMKYNMTYCSFLRFTNCLNPLRKWSVVLVSILSTSYTLPTLQVCCVVEGDAMD